MGRAAAGWDAVGVDDTADVADPTEEPEWLTSGGIGGAGCAASTGLALAFGGPAAATPTVSLRPREGGPVTVRVGFYGARLVSGLDVLAPRASRACWP